MSTVHGGPGNIVTSGLVLNLDAANPRSYPPPYNGTTWTTLAGSSNGTLINGPTFNSGNGGSIVFDGVNDYVATSYFGNNSNANYTFSIWYNPLSSVNTSPLTRGRDGSGAGWSLLLGSDNSSGNRYRAGVVTTDSGPIGYVTYSTTPMTLNRWVSLTGIWISGNSINLYINGVFNSSIPVPGNLLRTSTDGWVLGSITTTSYTNQQIAQVQIYNRALSASEISQNFNATRARFGI